MSFKFNGQEVDVVHVRYDGRSYDVMAMDLRVEEETSQQELFTAIETNLDLEQGSLNGYELDVVASTKTAVARPQAKFGIYG